MRKILISVVVCLLLIGSVFIMVNGIGFLNVNGFIGLKNKNQEIDKKILDLSNLTSVTYPTTESNLKKAANTLTDTKTEYENQAILSSSNSSSYISKLETYDIDYLWTKLGNYARDEGVVIKIDLTASGASSNLYCLNFSVTGGYVNITDFIYDIENDSKLGFKIDNFKMTGAETLNATFSCDEIPINVGQIEAGSSTTGEGEREGTANVGTDGTTNTTNTNSTTDTNTTTGNTTSSNTTNTSTTETTGNTAVTQ